MSDDEDGKESCIEKNDSNFSIKNGASTGKIKTTKNLLGVSVSFLLNFSAYASLEMVQSSLNAEYGILSLSAIYASSVLSFLLLPPLILSILGCRKSIAISTVTYILYTIANFFPQPYILIPAGVLVGCGSSVLWSAQRVYIAQLAFHNCEGRQKKCEEQMGLYHGIFYSIYSTTALGNIIMSILLSIKLKKEITLSSTESPQRYNSTSFTATISPEMSANNVTYCGIPSSDSWEPDAVGEEEGKVDYIMLLIVLGLFVGLQLLGIVIVMVICEDIPQSSQGNSATKSTEVEEQKEANVENTQNCENESVIEDEVMLKPMQQPTRSRISLILATIKLISRDRKLQLLIPSTVNFGVLHILMASQFMRFWVTCAIGISYVGYMAMTFGLTAALTSSAVGKLLKWFHRITIFCIACILEVGTLVAVLLWTPTETTNPALFFVWMACVSMSYTTQRCINTIVFAAFFVKTKEEAQSALGFVDSLGRAIMFGVAAVMPVAIHVYITLGLLITGMVMYFIAEKMHSNNLRKEAE